MKHYRVKPDKRVNLDDYDAHDTGGYKHEEEVADRTEKLRQKLDALQERLYAEGSRAVLIVLQGIDTGGKDGTIRHVMSGVNPQGCIVTSFKTPTLPEKAHDFLWRIQAACPPYGFIGIFNRSHYEDVLITRVHKSITDKEAKHRLSQIRDFEKMLSNNRTRILKFFLHISKDEQKKRLLARLDDPDKHWKFSAQDLKERGYWKAYRKAFEEALSATSTEESPWFVVPANHKWYRNLVVADCLVAALEDMNPRPPKAHGIDWKKLREEVSAS
ncbi:MAG TPA: polyphosphate kinase 2 family protein [Planctomycetota bacterium]|nr:polyphosphate kinase 2 family protein [Planctomycetota bacterium]